MRVPLLPATFLLWLPCLPAQTFVVDANNGPGTNFTDLAVAAAAVPDGATLVVRPGAYGPVHLQGKGMTILGGPAVMLNNILGSAVVVEGLRADQSFTLRGAFIGWTANVEQVRFTNCAGPMLLQDFDFDHRRSPRLTTEPLPQGVRIQGCRQVTLHTCSIVALDAVRAATSSVVLDGCTLAGTGSTTIIYHNPVFPGTHALVLEGAVAQIADCNLYGGPGVLPQVPPAAAIRLSSSTLHIGGATVVTAGVPVNFTAAVTAIIGTGTVVRDPLATFVTQGGAPALAAGLVDLLQPWPSVRTVVGVLGQPVAATVDGAHGELVLLCHSYPLAPSSVPGFAGEVWLDLGAATLLGIGVPAPSTPVSVTIPTPQDAALVGMRSAWQAASWSSGYGAQLSNASTYVHRL